MSRKKSWITATDQFSGCGGSSSGAQSVFKVSSVFIHQINKNNEKEKCRPGHL